ncbi:MAG TPA: hypothetical protein VM681_02670 [Candidatus Thermoplasmatota archaeon]|nr:hypothetical protein [Candidatus Thermoplasmatota archaeon]
MTGGIKAAWASRTWILVLATLVAGVPAQALETEDLRPERAETPAAGPTAEGPTGTGLDVDYRCGANVGSGTIGLPALVGSCLFEIVARALPTSSGTLLVDVVVTPTGGFPNQVVGVGYRGYNLGVRLDAVAGSPFKMTLSVSNVVVTVATGLCDTTASATFEIVAGASRIRSVEFTKGTGVLASFDPIGVSAPFAVATTGPATVSAALQGACSGNKQITLSLPGALSSLSGRYNGYTFSFTGIPTSLTLRVEDVSSTTKLVRLTHTSSTLSGTVSLGSSLGTLTLANAPRSLEVQIVRDASGDLSTLSATASNAPASGSDVQYAATVKGISIWIDIRKIATVTVFANMAAKSFSADLTFVNKQGFLDVDVAGSWKSVDYEVRMDGSGLGRVRLGVATSSPNVDLWANLRACASGCGSVQAVVKLTFFDIFDVGPTFRIERLSSGKYKLVVPDPLIDATVDEGFCVSWLSGRVRECAVSG